MHIHVVLLAFKFIDGDSFEHQVVVVVGFHRAGFEHGIDHPILGHAALDDLHMEIEVAGHLDGATEGDLTIPLGEVDVTHRELGAFDIDGEVDPSALGEVLDVAVAAMLPGRHGAGGFIRYPRKLAGGEGTEDGAVGVG